MVEFLHIFINVKKISGVFVIKDVLDGFAGSWVYEPLTDKWKYNAYNNNNSEIKVLDGFYVIDNIVYDKWKYAYTSINT